MEFSIDITSEPSHGALAGSRRDYLSSLPEPQELLLELLAAGGESYRIIRRGQTIGHFVVHAASVLIEFHLQPSYWVFGEVIIAQILSSLPKLNQAWVKSFDALFLSSALPHQQSVAIKGLLVRDYIPRELPAIASIQFDDRPATVADIDAMWEVDHEVFSDRSRLEWVVHQGYARVFVFDDQIIGFGLLRPLAQAPEPGAETVDVSVAVAKPYRRRGHAVYALRRLVEYCHERGLRAIAGCAQKNKASRYAGERIGFVARHRLLELSLGSREPAGSPRV